MEPNQLSDCPYVGLQPFSAKDQKYFFGRESDSRIISSNLFAFPLTVLYGSSGVGKSSILHAGVIPVLRNSSRTAVVSFQKWPEKDPIQILKDKCLEAICDVTHESIPIDMNLSFDEFLFQAMQAFHGTIIIILDQFEEYFLYHKEAETFDTEFARAVNRRETDAHFLIALREDSLSMLDRFRTRIPNMLGNSLRLHHLDGTSAREAICKPLDVYNQEHPGQSPVSIEPELVDALIKDVRAGKLSISQGAAGGVEDRNDSVDSDVRVEAPFLQLILTRLWDQEIRQGSHVLHLKTLNDLGGPKRIVQTHLDHAMKDLSPADQDIAASVFRYLVTPSGTKIAYTVQDLAFYAKSEKLESVLEKLAGSVRILRKVTLPGEPSRYEIYHDVLGSAILDWRTRYETTREQSQELTRRLKQQQEQTFIRWSIGATLIEILLIFLLPIGASVIKSGLRRQETPLPPEQIKSITRTWSWVSLLSSVVFLGATGVILYLTFGVSPWFGVLFLIGFGPSMIGKLIAAPYFAFRKYQQFRDAEGTRDMDTTAGFASAAVALK